MSRRRDEKDTPGGIRNLFPTGGRAGRAPGRGNTKGINVTSGGKGRSHPTQGMARSTFRQKPPEKNKFLNIMLNPKKPPKPKS
jgi:hypothetical protein